MHTTPVSLLERLRQPQERLAWDRFVELYTPLLYRWARSQGAGKADAADLVQEVLLVLLRTLPDFQYDTNGNFRGWLRTVTFNKWREWQRRRRPETVANLDDVPAPSDGSFEEMEYRRHVVARMLKLIESDFPPATWRLFQEHVVQGQDSQVVAAQRGVSLGTVYAAKSKVLKRLRQELQGLLE